MSLNDMEEPPTLIKISWSVSMGLHTPAFELSSVVIVDDRARQSLSIVEQDHRRLPHCSPRVQCIISSKQAETVSKVFYSRCVRKSDHNTARKLSIASQTRDPWRCTSFCLHSCTLGSNRMTFNQFQANCGVRKPALVLVATSINRGQANVSAVSKAYSKAYHLAT